MGLKVTLPLVPMFEANGVINSQWKEFFSACVDTINANRDSGETVNRPTKGLYIGRQYYDTDLDLPLKWSGTQWQDAAGNGV